MCFSVIVFLSGCCSEVGQYVPAAHHLEKRGRSGSCLTMAVGVLIHELGVYSTAAAASQITQAHRHTHKQAQSALSFLITSKYLLPIYRFTSQVSHQC